MKRLFNNTVWTMIISILISLILLVGAGYIFHRIDMDKQTQMRALTILGSIIAYTINTTIKLNEQQRINDSTLVETNIKLIEKLSSLINAINEGVFRTNQITLVYGIAELANKHDFLKIPAKKSLEDIERWSKDDSAGHLYYAAKNARESIR